jgi:hypothetical protein
MVPAELASYHAVSLRTGEDLPVQCRHLVPAGISDRDLARSPSDIRDPYGRLWVAPLVLPSILMVTLVVYF